MYGLAKIALVHSSVRLEKIAYDYEDANRWSNLTIQLEENDPTYKQLSDAESDAYKHYHTLQQDLSQGKGKAGNIGLIAGSLLGAGAGVGLSVPLRKKFGTAPLESHPVTLGILGGGIGLGTGISAGEKLFDTTHRKQYKERDEAKHVSDQASERLFDYAGEKGYY